MAEVSLPAPSTEEVNKPKPMQQNMNGAPPPGGYQFKLDPIAAFAQNYLQPNPSYTNTAGQTMLSNIFLPSDKTAQGGLGMASSLYGTNLAEIGASNQELIKRRREAAFNPSESPYIQAMKQQRNDEIRMSRANAGQSGVKGGVQAGRERQISREAGRDVASEQARWQDKAMNDYQSLMSRVTGTTMSLPLQMQALEKSGEYQTSGQAGFTVICTELKRQGILPEDVWEADQAYGKFLIQEIPAVWEGYYVWAKYVAKAMKKSRLFSKAVGFFAIPWAKHIAGQFSFRGALIHLFGVPMCYLIGSTLRLTKDVYARR